MAPSDSRLRPDQSAMEVRPAETQFNVCSEIDCVFFRSEATLMLPRNSKRSSKRSSEPSAKRHKTKAATRPRQCGSRRKAKSGSTAESTVSRAHTFGALKRTLVDEGFFAGSRKARKERLARPRHLCRGVRKEARLIAVCDLYLIVSWAVSSVCFLHCLFPANALFATWNATFLL